MTTWTWIDTSGDWYDSTAWSTASSQSGVPAPGDSVVINSGTVNVLGTKEATAGVPIDALQITFGSTSAANPAVIAATGALFGRFNTLVSSGSAGYAVIDAIGATGFAGRIVASAPGGLFAVTATAASGTQAAVFDLLHGGAMNVSGGDVFELTGTMISETSVTIGPIARSSTTVSIGFSAARRPSRPRPIWRGQARSRPMRMQRSSSKLRCRRRNRSPSARPGDWTLA